MKYLNVTITFSFLQAPPISNPRFHRRSKSVGTDTYLEHKGKVAAPMATILQPYYKTSKTVNQPEMKDITNSRTSRYCLITQNADTDGELETLLYKGDVIPTTSGGAQVVFDDVECLKQFSPTGSPSRKRSSAAVDDPTTPGRKKSSQEVVEKRCSIGIQGHSTKKQRI